MNSPRTSTLHLDTRPDWRGGQHQILRMLCGLRSRGHEVELMALAGGALERRARAERFCVHAFPAHFTRAGGAVLLRRLLTQKRFDIIHAHDPHALTAAWLAGAHRHALLVVHRRVSGPLSQSYIALARYRAARRIIAVSRYVARSVIESGIAGSVVEVLHEGVDLAALPTQERRRELRQRWGIAENQVLLGCVGYLVPKKGQDTLLRALPAVRERFPNARLLLAGDGPCRPALEKLARVLGVQDNVIFGGFIGEIEQVYPALDLFVFPSLDEGLPISLLTAMANELPVVAVASGGVPEIVDNGRNGLLVPAARAEDLAGSILCLLTDRALAAQLGAAARTTVAQEFAVDRMVEGMIHTYSQVLAEQRR